jgi:hypothetical protein
MTSRTLVGGPLFAAGLLIMAIEYALHVYGHFRGSEYRIGMGPIGIGAVLTFIGWFWLNKKDALDGGRFIVDAFTNVVGVIRSGRRASDPVVAVTKTAPASSTGIVHLPDPVVTEEHDG